MTDSQRINIQAAKLLADKYNIAAEFLPHQQSGRTTADAMSATGFSSEEIIKTLILFAPKDDIYVGAIILGSQRIDIKKVIQASSVKKLNFANKDQVKNLTGFQIGGVPPVAVSFCNMAFIDIKVAERDSVLGAGGDEHCGMVFSPQQLISNLGFLIIDIAQS